MLIFTMKDKLFKILDSSIYWSIVAMPFSVAISPGFANAFIGFFCAPFLIKKFLKKERVFIHTPVNWAFVALMVISLISMRNSVDWRASIWGLVKLLKYALIFLICAEEIRDIKHIKRIIISTALGASLVGIDAVWQLTFGKDFVWGQTLAPCTIGLRRASASFPGCNMLGIYLSSITPLLWGLALFYYQGKAKILILAAGFLATLGLSLTFSRGAGLGLYLALVYMGIVKRHKILIAALLCLLLIYPLLMPKNIKDWAKSINYNIVVFMCNPDRISMYKNTVNMIKHHPFVGVGVNTFVENYAKYKLPGPDYAKTPAATYAHNIYLQMAGETGLIGLGAFFCFLFMLFRQGAAVYHKLRDDYLKIIALSVLACCLAFLVNGLTETNLYHARIAMMFWYLSGFSLALKKFSS